MRDRDRPADVQPQASPVFLVEAPALVLVIRRQSPKKFQARGPVLRVRLRLGQGDHLHGWNELCVRLRISDRVGSGPCVGCRPMRPAPPRSPRPESILVLPDCGRGCLIRCPALSRPEKMHRVVPEPVAARTFGVVIFPEPVNGLQERLLGVERLPHSEIFSDPGVAIVPLREPRMGGPASQGLPRLWVLVPRVGSPYI